MVLAVVDAAAALADPVVVRVAQAEDRAALVAVPAVPAVDEADQGSDGASQASQGHASRRAM